MFDSLRTAKQTEFWHPSDGVQRTWNWNTLIVYDLDSFLQVIPHAEAQANILHIPMQFAFLYFLRLFALCFYGMDLMFPLSPRIYV